MPDLALWQRRINEATGVHARQHRRWIESQEMLEGKWMRNSLTLDPDYTPVNYAKAYISAVVASIYARNPYFFVKSRTRRHVNFARSMEIVLNYLMKELAIKQAIKRAITDSLITGIGWLEVGYTATFGTLEPETANDQGGLFSQLLKKPKRPSQQGVLNEYVKEISAYVVRQSPWRVFMAPGYHDTHEMPYLITAEDIAPESVELHPLYRRYFSADSALRSLRAEKDRPPISLPGMMAGFGHPAKMGKESQFARIYHIWDRWNMKRFLWMDGTQDTSPDFDWKPSFEGFSQVPMIFNNLPENDRTANAYPIGDLTFMMPQLRELNLLRTMMAKRRKRTSGQIVAQETALTDEQAYALQNSDDLTLIRMKGNPSTDIASFKPADLSADVYKIGERILADLDLIGQLGFLLPTISGDEDRTATEARFRAAGSGTVRSEKVDVVEETLRQVGRRLRAVVWEFYPRDVIANILGEEQLPEELWPTPPDDPDRRREIIEREMEDVIEVGSTQPIQDKSLKNEQKIRLLNILGGIAPERIKVTSKGLGELVQDFEMPELSEWMILDDDKEAQVAQKENELLQQNIPQLVSPNELHQVHEQIHAQIENPTPASDQHLLQHRQFRLAKQPAKASQKGDEGGTRGSAANPEAQRQGAANISDLIGAIGQANSERGLEKGGIPNA